MNKKIFMTTIVFLSQPSFSSDKEVNLTDFVKSNIVVIPGTIAESNKVLRDLKFIRDYTNFRNEISKNLVEKEPVKKQRTAINVKTTASPLPVTNSKPKKDVNPIKHLATYIDRGKTVARIFYKNQYRVVKIGDRVGNLTVTSIKDSFIEMRGNGNRKVTIN